jgi:signal transduction histidine kinase
VVKYQRENLWDTFLKYLKKDKSFLLSLFLPVVILPLSLIWLLYTFFFQLTSPSLHPLAMIKLACHTKILPSKGTYCQDVKQLNSLIVWPTKGQNIEKENAHFMKNFTQVLKENYPLEFKNLIPDEKKSLLQQSFPLIGQKIREKLSLNIILKPKALQKNMKEFESFEELSIFLSSYLDHSRYTWGGFNKTVYYILLKNKDGHKVYYVSLSDLADKFYFFKVIFLPNTLFIFSSFYILFLLYKRIVLLYEKLRERMALAQDLLDNSGQGFFSFSQDFKIDPEFSKPCYDFFGRDINNSDPFDILFHQLDDKILTKDIVKMVLKEEQSLDMVRELLPKEILLNSITLALEYFLIENPHSDLTKNKMMIVLTDISKEKKLAQKLKKKEEAKEFILYVATNPEFFIDFTKEAQKTIQRIDDQLAKSPEKINWEDVLRDYHSIKGGFGLSKMNDCSLKIHKLENEVQTFISLSALEQKILIKFFLHENKNILVMIDGALEKVSTLIQNFNLYEQGKVYKIEESRLDQFHEQILDVVPSFKKKLIPLLKMLKWERIRPIFNKYRMLILDLSHKLAKPINVNIEGENTLVPMTSLKPMLLALFHLLRNSVDHGIEKRKERAETDKDPTGNISLHAKTKDSYIILEIKDDGRGINLEQISKKYNSKFPQTKKEHTASFETIFLPGMTTKKNITELSGRGMGMTIVKKEIDHLKGHIQVNSSTGKGTSFTIKIPFKDLK